jgi:hypothetical protein
VSVGEVFWRLWPYARPYRRWLPVIVVLAVLGPAIEAAKIWMYKVVVDDPGHPRLDPDERTTGLDSESGQRIIEPLGRLMKGRTIIVISHDQTTVREATSIAVLVHGRPTEYGTHRELLLHGCTYGRLYRLHQPEEQSSEGGRRLEADLRRGSPVTAKCS